MDEDKLAKLREYRAERKRLLDEAWDRLNDDPPTVEKMRLLEALFREMREIEKDREARRKEHRSD
jgi:hypothetical protein